MGMTFGSGIRITGGLSVTSPPPSDPYFSYTSLLLPGNGTNNAQNNTFLDSSTNNFTITRNGNTTQGTFSPYGGNWSNYFDGTGDYLEIASSTAFAFGTDNFTVEAWIYPLAYGGTVAGASIFGTVAGSASGYSLNLGESQDRMRIISNASGTWADNLVVSAGGGAPLNTWSHIAWVRNGDSMTIYKNGTSVATMSGVSAYNFTSPANAGFIGFFWEGSSTRTFNGYISNSRVIKGTALYTSSFTPSTTPLTAVANTQLLTCQSNRFIDNSTNNFTVIKYQDTSIQRFSPFSPSATYSANTIGGSGYFDGTGDYLVTPASSQLALATNAADFTMECWVYNNGGAGSQYGRGISIYYPSGGYGSNRLMFRLIAGGDRLNLYLLANGSAEFGGPGVDGTATITIGAWTHVALVRNTGVFYAYVNGVLDITVNSSSAASSIPFTTFNTMEVGRTQDGASPDWFGNISNYRFVKGTAVYTSNFVPPSQSITAVTNTALLLDMTNAGIIDNAMMNNLETVGNAQISTTQSKFGGSSMYFDGTGDWLVSPVSTNLGMGTGDFTIEGWFYATSPTYAQGFFHINQTAIGATVAGYAIGVTASGAIQYYAGNTFTTSSSTITANTWTHLALVRSAGTVKVYVNGILPASGGSIADSQNVTSALAYLGVFYTVSGGVAYTMTGYIDDFRITKGYARYTANFTPSTTAFPTY